MTFAIPTELRSKMLDLHGEAGEAWLGALPETVAACARQWSLTLAPPFADVGYSYVAPTTRADGSRAVLKITYPDDEARCEREALCLYDGRGAIQVFAADVERSALLLEYPQPGTQLLTVADDEGATRIAARVMRDLWRPAPAQHSFPTVGWWGRGFRKLREQFDSGTGPLPTPLVERAESLFAELLASSAVPVLLHGDFQHYNVLQAERAPWLAIDPKGVIGEPAYEPGAFLRNPFDDPAAVPHLDRLLARRLDIFAEELNLDWERLHGWALAQGVLSAWWSIEDHGEGWESAIVYTDALASLRP